MACVSLAFIDGLGAPEMLLIFVIVLVLFGGQKLPEFARGLGKSIREFKKAAAGVEEEFKRALEEDERKHATPQIAPPASTVPALTAGSDPAGPDSNYHHYDEYGNEIPPPTEVVATPATSDEPAAASGSTTPAATIIPETPVLPETAASAPDPAVLPSPEANTPKPPDLEPAPAPTPPATTPPPESGPSPKP